MLETPTRTHLVLNYRPSQAHGWPPGPGQAVGTTIGGHVAAKDFTHGGRTYRISLLPFGQPGDTPNPVYEDEPDDPDIAFKETLAATFGAHYAFRYQGFRGQRELEIQSYSVFADRENEFSPVVYGADLYVVYEPDAGSSRSVIPGTLRWIQVVKRSRADGAPESHVEPVGGTHPFFPTGGRVSIYGERVVNFAYFDGVFAFPGAPDGDDAVLAETFMAEAFLVRDTGVNDAGGKNVLEVMGGLKYGWQVQERQP